VIVVPTQLFASREESTPDRDVEFLRQIDPVFPDFAIRVCAIYSHRLALLKASFGNSKTLFSL
jgi:hypothetical protein